MTTLSDLNDDEFQRRVRAYQSEKAAAEDRRRREAELHARRQRSESANRNYLESALAGTANAARARGLPSMAIYIAAKGRRQVKFRQVGVGWEIVRATKPAQQDRWQDTGFSLGRRGVILRSDGRDSTTLKAARRILAQCCNLPMAQGVLACLPLTSARNIASLT